MDHAQNVYTLWLLCINIYFKFKKIIVDLYRLKCLFGTKRRKKELRGSFWGMRRKELNLEISEQGVSKCSRDSQAYLSSKTWVLETAGFFCLFVLFVCFILGHNSNAQGLLLDLPRNHSWRCWETRDYQGSNLGQTHTRQMLSPRF